MKVYYSRVSTEEQNAERQLQELKEFDYIITDTCSGSIEFFERPKGITDQGIDRYGEPYAS